MKLQKYFINKYIKLLSNAVVRDMFDTQDNNKKKMTGHFQSFFIYNFHINFPQLHQMSMQSFYLHTEEDA